MKNKKKYSSIAAVNAAEPYLRYNINFVCNLIVKKQFFFINNNNNN